MSFRKKVDVMAETVHRKACDRCHAQKLSCKRYNDEACERCVRLKTECKSSPSLRYRKNQQQQLAESQQQQQQQFVNNGTTSSLTATSSGRRSPKRRRTDSQEDPSLVSPDTDNSLSLTSKSHILPVSVPVPVSPDPVVDSTDFAFTFDQQLAFFTNPQYLSHSEFPGTRPVFWEPAPLYQHQHQQPPEHSYHQQHVVPLSCAPEHSSTSDKRAPRTQSKQQQRRNIPRPRQITLRHDADLSPLQQHEVPPIHWMAQLSDINARLLDLASALPSPQDGPLMGRPVDERFRSQGFPIEDMFKLTRRVADILEKPPSNNDGSKIHHSTIDGSDPGNVMFILSTYVRLLDMYQRVFSLVHTELATQTDTGTTFSFWKLPAVTVGSFAVESSPFLQMSLTIQLAEEFLSRLRGSTARWSGAGNAASVFAGVVDVSFQAFRDREEALAKHLVELRSEIEPLIDS
ncbi:hypothetical protein FOXG_13751 [Fusarium oxysporum f. sp. lycopersici 4287]|uniref:Zn(2)-C6 fungal-type domain-containing protein n=3 Tax=Fusarium oxysporum TaxID=5507 RepID=A0A0J9VWS0_FUSO4|nr:hypothetical protein FOXG_13751 [Fusarium oxysporum f. sp. lycopersici 4287]EXK34785.1 hypothetical protein FOMG_10146 [Fusarium oxysporum f. sp. melonis 26406]KNB15030.1 hypothetical protein FOXG_13751 [Fusarium oxysporum f. sp. lycopersici 4287]